MSISTSANRFENETPAETATVFTVERTTLGKEKVFEVDSVLTDETKGAIARMRSFFLVRKSRW